MQLKELEDKIVILEDKVVRLEGRLNLLNQIVDQLTPQIAPKGGVPEPTQKAPKLRNGKNNHKF